MFKGAKKCTGPVNGFFQTEVVKSGVPPPPCHSPLPPFLLFSVKTHQTRLHTIQTHIEEKMNRNSPPRTWHRFGYHIDLLKRTYKGKTNVNKAVFEHGLTEKARAVNAPPWIWTISRILIASKKYVRKKSKS